MGNKSWILRDVNKRIAATKVEAARNAYLAVARNTTLPAQTRHKAQLALNNYNDGVGRMVSIKNRCMWTGRGYGVLTNFAQCRFQFRQNALAGRIPGMSKGSW